MKRCISLYFILITLLYGDNHLDKNYEFAVNIGEYNKINQNKIKSIVSRISKTFANRFDNKYGVNVTFIDNVDEVVDEYIRYKKYNSLVIYSSSYLKYMDKLKEVSKYFFTFDNNIDFQRYVLVVNNSSNIKSIKDIKNKKFLSFSSNDNYSDWLDYLTLKELNKSYKKLIKEEINVEKDAGLVLKLFFDKGDFAVIRKSSYKDLVLLNPSIEKKVSILIESEPIFFYGIGLFHKNTSEEIINGFDGIVIDGSFNGEYNHLIKMLDSTKIKRIFPKDLEKLETFYKKYVNLKRKVDVQAK
ncbi:hypothetical protein CRV08_11180 [Halarcobacter ebronensis]|uniref:Solute-binding protein family 3/N-terminal domain-containing protein n=1 Tax=Halarcobacter ebronensis TaxID=1462615 RepID=A0A4Q0YA44_9BACT|nr:PhnD/SsuA/transferrin family substrate-binding protein [Halarcobacter ebronensis]RXJ67146.1 hypothetical protein CRV08_11180 [Halarcobacter ebronensis]